MRQYDHFPVEDLPTNLSEGARKTRADIELVSSPAFLDHYGRPENPADLPKFNAVASTDDIFDGGARWNLIGPNISS